MRRKNLILGAAGLLLLAGAAAFFLRSDQLRRSWYLKVRMHEAAPGVLVQDGLPAEREREFAALAAAGRARAEEWFGPLQNRALIVFVHEAGLKGELGVQQPYAWNPIEERNERLYIGPKGLSEDLVAHGIAHAEIKARLGLELWPGLPAWFDEGIATQLDWRPFLQREALGQAEGIGAEAMRALADHAAFQGGAGDAGLVTAKRELTRWLDAAGGRPAMDALFAALQQGEAFDSAYARLETARSEGR